MKSCTCGITGPENFYRNRTRLDGFSFYCKACTATQRREEYARKYPEGKNGGNAEKAKALIGNKRAEKHGRYSGTKKQKTRSVVPRSVVVKERTYLDTLISAAW